LNSRTEESLPTAALRLIGAIGVTAIALWVVEADRLKTATPVATMSAPAAAPRSLPEIDLAATIILTHQKEALFIDVRSHDAFARGRIKGAISIPLATLGDLSDELREKIAQASNIVVYCDQPVCGDSRVAAKMLTPLARSVAIYPGGWNQWKKLGLPYEID